MADKVERQLERQQRLRRFQRRVELPMLVLAACWLALLLMEFSGHADGIYAGLSRLIWLVFVIEFCVELILAPRKSAYVRQNLLVLVSLFLPAVRMLKIFRLFSARSLRAVHLLRMGARLNRGITLLSRSFRQRGLLYVLLITVAVILSASFGIYYLERGNPEIGDYWSALWWTSMMITTMGSGAWPRTAEGRILAFILAVYAFSVFGYFTAVVAAFFIDGNGGGRGTGLEKRLASLEEKLDSLRRGAAQEPGGRP